MGRNLSELDFDEITYYVKPSEQTERSWDEVPDEIKRTFDKLGIPEAEQKYLAGYQHSTNQKLFTQHGERP